MIKADTEAKYEKAQKKFVAKMIEEMDKAFDSSPANMRKLMVCGFDC